MPGTHVGMWVRVVGLTVAVSWAVSGGTPDPGEPLAVKTGRVVVVCPLTIGGRFEVTSSAVTGQVLVDERSRELDGAFSVDLRSLDAGIGLRTSHLKGTYLEVQRGTSFDTATLSRIVLDVPVGGLPNGPVGFQGQFTLHGQTRPITGNVDLARKDGRYDVKVRFTLRIDAFDIPKPTYLGVGVSNVIDVTVQASLIRPAPSSR